MSDIKVGDRVRVTFEATVRRANSAFVSLEGDDGWIGELNYLKVPVEKIEPPVETFGPGDVVRSRTDGCVRALSSDGYVKIPRGEFFRYDDRRRGACRLEEFTSKRFERVEI